MRRWQSLQQERSSICAPTASLRSGSLCGARPRRIAPSMAADRPFDTAAFDSERLRLDSEAMSSTAARAVAESAQEAALPGSKEGAWKWALRQRMWDYMEEHDIARFPRPVHHRIPNFVDADKAAELLATLQEFQAATCVKVNPDTPQKAVRRAVLAGGKVLLTPQPRLRTGFFSTLSLQDFPEEALAEACTSAGAAKYGTPLGLGASDLKVDLIVVGSSCVSLNGCRLGKGEGFAELEYGILRWMGAIDASTPVVTTVHDCQVLAEDIEPGLMLEHDVPVDIIVTPTRIIRTRTRLPKPPGILWHKLSPEKLAQIRVLQSLKRQIEEETGTALPSGPSEQLPPLAVRKGPGGGRGRRGGRGGGRRGRGRGGDGAGGARSSSGSGSQAAAGSQQ